MGSPQALDPDEKVLMTRKEAATRYSLSVPQVDRFIVEGVLPSIKFGRRCLRIPVKLADQSLLRTVGN